MERITTWLYAHTGQDCSGVMGLHNSMLRWMFVNDIYVLQWVWFHWWSKGYKYSAKYDLRHLINLWLDIKQ